MVRLFGKKETPAESYSIDDLIVLERYEEAEARLRDRLKKTRGNIRNRVRYAEVLSHLGKREDAIEEYLYAGQTYEKDGFLEKAEALYAQAYRLNPVDEKLQLRLDRIKMLRDIAHKRGVAVKALRASSDTDVVPSANAAIELEQVWNALSKTELVRFLPAAVLERFLRSISVEKAPTRTTLVERGEELPILVLLVDGELEAWFSRDDGPFTVRTFGPGDIVGDLALFQKQPWPANYRFTTPSRYLLLQSDGLEKALQGNPDPRRLLEGLRRQGNDEEVANIIAKMGF